MLLTLKQVAQQIGAPESTLRRYRDLCENAVPVVDTGRGVMYPEEAVEIFRKIRFLREARLLEWSDVRTELARKAERKVAVEPHPDEEKDDKLPPDVRYLEFQLNTVARQLLSVLEEAMGAQSEDIKTIRRTLKLIARQNRKYQEELNMNLLMLLDKVTELQSGVAYLHRRDKRGEKAE